MIHLQQELAVIHLHQEFAVIHLQHELAVIHLHHELAVIHLHQEFVHFVSRDTTAAAPGPGEGWPAKLTRYDTSGTSVYCIQSVTTIQYTVQAD